MAGWAEAFMTLRVDRSQVTKDVDAGLGAANGTAAGKRMGGQFGDALTKEATPRLRDMQGRFVTDSGTAGDRAGQAAGRSFASAFAKLTEGIVAAFLRGASGQIGGGGASGGGSGGGFLSRIGGQGGDNSFMASLAAGIGPSILGLQVLGKAGGIAGLGALGLGALPAAAAGGAGIGIAGAGAGAIAGLFSGVQSQVGDAGKAVTALQTAKQAQAAATTPAQAASAAAAVAAAQAQVNAINPALVQMYQTEQKIGDWWKTFTARFAPAFNDALKQVAALLQSLTPVLQQFFSGALTLMQPVITGLGDIARQILPLLGQAFRAAAPLLAPLITGLGQLVAGLLPGLIALLRAAQPAVQALGNIFASLGTGLGSMLAAFAPVVQTSAILLGDIGSVITALLPIIGQLAGIFATALAPAFTQFAALIQSALPALTLIGQVVAQIAAAMLGALSAALSAVISLFTAIMPALTGFLHAISGIFVVLENSGVFAILGNAIEALAVPLAGLINALLRGLTPILPPIINLIGQVAGILATGLAGAIALLLPPLTQLATQALALIGRFLPPLIPLFQQLAQQLTTGLVQAVAALVPSLILLANSALSVLAILLPVVVPLITTFARVLTGISVVVITDLAKALNAVITAIPVGALQGIVIGILAVVAAIRVFAATSALISLATGPVGLVVIAVAALAVGIVELATHWNQVWTNIRNWASNAAQFLGNLFRNRIVQDILAVWSLGLIPLATHWNQVWTNIKNWSVDTWHGIYNNVLAPMINWFTVTLPHAFTTAWGQVQTWWRNTTGAFSNGWRTIYNNVIAPIQRVFTTDLGNWFHTAVTKVGQFWTGLQKVVHDPVAWVIHNVLGGLAHIFDDITNAIGLNKPLAGVEAWAKGFASGGKVTGPGGPRADRAGLYALSDTEWVINARAAQGYGDAAMAAVNSGRAVIGYADGGKVGQNPPLPVGAFGAGAVQPGTISGAAHAVGSVVHKALDIVKITSAIFSQDVGALTNAFSDLTGARSGASGLIGQILTQVPKTLVGDVVKWLMSNGGGSGSAIADYAASFIGKIPYVWGGTNVPGGADCSGFVQAIYEHFGIGAPRTSEAQGAWVTRGAPTPGGLAFYHSPPGGPDPGHVAIVAGRNQVISQGGGMGPKMEGLNFLPLLWTGTPPGGFGKSGPTGPAAAGSLQAYARALVDRRWGDGQWGAFVDIVQRESGWQVNAINPTSGAYGIPQALPGSKMASAGADWRTSGYTQLRWMVDYIASRWGTPGSADANERTAHWYAQGGPILEPVTGVGRYTGALYSFGEAGREWVTPGGRPPGGGGDSGAMLASEIRQLRQLLDTVPSRTAAGVARAVRAPEATIAQAARVGAR